MPIPQTDYAPSVQGVPDMPALALDVQIVGQTRNGHDQQGYTRT
jgi:hypothetical protein